jgi:hypothetical protein
MLGFLELLGCRGGWGCERLVRWPGVAFIKVLFHAGDVRGQHWSWRDLTGNRAGATSRESMVWKTGGIGAVRGWQDGLGVLL